MTSDAATFPPSKVRIAAAQYPLDQFATLDGCRDKLARWVGDAAQDGAELLVFPEYGAMEFAAPDAASAGDLAASLNAASDGIAVMETVYSSLARRHNVHILAASGPCRQHDGCFVNRSKLFAPSGVYAQQDKLMMTPFEIDWGISAGTKLRVFETKIGTIGIAICYDSEFPLLVRALCDAGADIILIPSCTEFMSGYTRVRTAALARALENGCVTVQSPTIGNALWSPAVDRNSGIAGIFVPSEHGFSETGILAEGVASRVGWVTATVDLAHLQQLRSSGEMRNKSDWMHQPGAGGTTVPVERCILR